MADHISGYNIWVLICPLVLLSLSKSLCRCRAIKAWNCLDLQVLIAFQKCLRKKMLWSLNIKFGSQGSFNMLKGILNLGLACWHYKKNQYPVPWHLFPLKLSRFCCSPFPSFHASRFLCTSSPYSHSGTVCTTLLFSVSGWSCAHFLALTCWTAGLL